MITRYKNFVFFSDLHSNYYALKQMYQYLKRLNENTKVFFLGDLLGYYEFDARIIDIFHKMLSEYGLTLILGNHDAKFLNTYFNTTYKIDCMIPSCGKISRDRGIRKEIKELLQLSKMTEEVMIFDRKTVISHGGIVDPLNAYYYPDLEFMQNNEHEKNTDYVFGHTHHYFIYTDIKTNSRFFNVGSLGMPRNKEVFGSYLEIRPNAIEIKKIAYDLDLQFEANNNLINTIRNRVYFAGNSKFIEENLDNFDVLEVNRFNKFKSSVIYFKKLILIDGRIKVLKIDSGYILIIENMEKKYNNLELLVKELENEV